ncbi:MAG: N-6 DNA methylase [Lachnospiraceae bacterium]|nr:N-6 DNA methylase [Lachnospiraceae bacterium]
MLDYIIERTNKYIDSMPKKERKKFGQFFTSKETARFMAGLFTIPEDLCMVRILDAGAGSGILSCAVLERLEQIGSVQMIELTCYENDNNILSLLKENLMACKDNSEKNIQIKIITDNYITSQYLDFNSMLGSNPNPVKYDFVIGNPPYMKISKDAPEATAMQNICYGAPNLYFIFAAMGLFKKVATRSWNYRYTHNQ